MTTPILKKLDADDSKARIQEKINSNFARCGAWSLATGFVSDDNNANIGVDYNATDRTVILTGDFKAYHEGILVPELTDGWVSPSHDATTGVTYFLRHNGTQFLFDSNAWDIQHDLLIASLQNGTLKILLREVHGVDMSGIEHMRWHYEFGTGRYPNGMAFTNVTPNSTTPANRRPYISGVALMDEDLRTNLPDLSTNSYCQRYLTGSSATGTRTFLTAQTDIVKLSGNQPLYNQWTGSTWTDTPFPNNHYGKIFLVAIPAGDNADSQSVRLMWVQPQQTSLDIDYIRNITSADIKHGDPSSLVAEYNFIGEWIIKYTASNWSITEFNELTGNRVQQTSGTAGYGLATATTDGLMSSTNFNKLAAMSGYIVAIGTSGNWHYKKYSDNTFEAFTIAAIDSGTLTMTQISTSQMWASNTLTLTLPSIGIQQVRHANFEQLTTSYTTSIAKNNGVGATVTYQINKNGSSTSAVSHTAHIWGTWA